MVELNPEQRQAVEHGEGPLLIIAGPGSGKTCVITERIVRLLRTVPGLQPENILAVTFTDKAAAEMKRRVREALPEAQTAPHISTFHAFCYEVLRKRHFERMLLDEVDVWIFLRRRIDELGLDFYQKLAEPGAFLRELNAFFSRCRDELIEPEDFEHYARRVEQEFAAKGPALASAERKLEEMVVRKLLELARVFRNSRRLIEEAGCSILGSLIAETIRLFDREPEVLESYRRKFRFVLVDEFQDTNFAQVELLRRLAAPPHNITAVGDDDQAIYRFRGAAHGAFEMFAAAFPGQTTVFLNRNYRSTKRILRAAESVIAQNVRPQKKPALKTSKPEGDRLFLLHSADYQSEAEWIAAEIERLHRKENLPFENIAVLYRAHSHRDLLVAEFRRRGIPFTIRGLSILSTVLLRDLVAYLSVVDSPHDNISLTRVLLAARWRFPEELALEIRRQAARDRCSLYDVLRAWEKTPRQADLARTGWPELHRMLKGLRRQAGSLSVTRLFDWLLESLAPTFLPGSREQSHLDTFRRFLAEWEEKIARLPQLIGRTAEEAAAPGAKSLRAFMEYLRYFLDAGGKIETPEPESASGVVQMMTVHAAKGLEFPVVFVVSVAPRRFPTTERKPIIEFPDELRKAPAPPENIHTQEERRLFFVAMTRAMERLYISSVTKPGKKPSKFIDDLLSDAAVAVRDVERIEVPPQEIPPAALPAAPQPPTRGGTQPTLFGEAEASDALYPDIAAWASRLPEISPSQKLQLSASAVEEYQDCPLKFKFSHLLKIPTGPQPALTFGNIMHQCVRRYFDLRRGGAARFEDLEEFYLRAWKDAGFEDEYQEQAYKKAGLEQLREFVRKHEGSATLPLDTEAHFALDLGDLVLEGRIDQINPFGAGDHAVELVDYKTGRPRSQKDADSSLQLSVYALAARDGMKMKPDRLAFYNLSENEPVYTTRTPQDLSKAVREIRDVAGQIRQMIFHATPGFACKWCDYRPICPAHEEY
ncbi:MAG: ATP-dependent helicase [Acidobacteriia bacterium]|nr:ATP-dependent helicase [Terriglobia bacterium]